jgi:hypothetical protein
MSIKPGTLSAKKFTLFCLVLLCFVSGAYAFNDNTYQVPEPGLYLNLNEGSGMYAIDSSGNGNTGTMHGVSRFENGGCGRAAFFNGINSYIEIPFSSQNHPATEITVSLWFYTDSYEPQVLLSTYEDGGYRLAFDDGEDLWWTVNLGRFGDVSIPVQHESIQLHQWHQVTGTYDGQSLKVYLDGILRNRLNATGAIHYQYNNYVTAGADAGFYNQTDQNCPLYFRGGLDEIRIYPVALTYGQVMDDRFRCPQEPAAPPGEILIRNQPLSSCAETSGLVNLGPNEVDTRILSFSRQSENATWDVDLPPGSTLVVKAQDLYSVSYPDAWYIEISDQKERITRSIAFPNTNNAPVKGVIPSGNASVLIRYFDGRERFPAQVAIQFESVTPKSPVIPPQTILNYPIIVIYSASWVTLIAIIVVMIWLHFRKIKMKNSKFKKETE